MLYKRLTYALALALVSAGIAACDDDDTVANLDGGVDAAAPRDTASVDSAPVDSAPSGVDAGADAAKSDAGPTSFDASSDAAPACPTGAMGTLTVAVAGLPAGAAAGVTATGPDTVERAISMTWSSLVPTGPYTIAARRVAPADPIVRTLYVPSVSAASVCVRADTVGTSTVTYAAIASSGKLWTGNAGASSFLGFASSTLAATGTPPATVAANTHGGGGFAFDKDGNVWTIGGTLADPPLARFSAATLGTSGPKTPDIVINSAALGGNPLPASLAFDSAGNLWVSVPATQKIVRFTPAQLAATGAPIPAVELTGIEGPQGLAFDSEGSLWVAHLAGVGKVSAARLGTTGAGFDVAVSPLTPAPVIGPLRDGTGLAFDSAGNLWVAFGGTLAKLTVADRTPAAGAKTVMPTPAVQVQSDVLGLPLGIAFDEGGGLWVAASAGKFARFSAATLATSGTKAPDVAIASPDVTYAQWTGLFPAPAATPLYHRAP